MLQFLQLKKKKNYYDFSLVEKLRNETVLYPNKNYLLEESMPHKSWGLVW